MKQAPGLSKITERAWEAHVTIRIHSRATTLCHSKREEVKRIGAIELPPSFWNFRKLSNQQGISWDESNSKMLQG